MNFLKRHERLYAKRRARFMVVGCMMAMVLLVSSRLVLRDMTRQKNEAFEAYQNIQYEWSLQAVDIDHLQKSTSLDEQHAHFLKQLACLHEYPLNGAVLNEIIFESNGFSLSGAVQNSALLKKSIALFQSMSSSEVTFSFQDQLFELQVVGAC